MPRRSAVARQEHAAPQPLPWEVRPWAVEAEASLPQGSQQEWQEACLLQEGTPPAQATCQPKNAVLPANPALAADLYQLYGAQVCPPTSFLHKTPTNSGRKPPSPAVLGVILPAAAGIILPPALFPLALP